MDLKLLSQHLTRVLSTIVLAPSLAEDSHGTCLGHGVGKTQVPSSHRARLQQLGAWALSDPFSFLPLISAFYRHTHSCFRSTVFRDQGLWSQLCRDDRQQLPSQFVAFPWPKGKRHVSQRGLWAASNRKLRPQMIQLKREFIISHNWKSSQHTVSGVVSAHVPCIFPFPAFILCVGFIF